jgi:hypothetical protein
MSNQYQIDARTDLSTRAPAVSARLSPQEFSIPGRIKFSVRTSSTDFESVELSRQFRRLERKWKRDTEFMSSLADKYLHESYAQIIGMGPRVVPLILRSLMWRQDDWFYALRAITRANPVSSSDAGDMEKMSRSWLAWGSKRGLI